MYTTDRDPINQPLRPWPVALDLPMANQAKHLKNLMLSRPFLSRIPDQTLLLDTLTNYQDYQVATRCSAGRYAMVYLPKGGRTRLDLSSLASAELTTWWYDPRTGSSFPGASVSNATEITIAPPSSGQGHDWVLVVDVVAEGFVRPGALTN
ncbi:MAG: putative collagen-binding domain-containing protein [Bacteroidota bacterium]